MSERSMVTRRAARRTRWWLRAGTRPRAEHARAVGVRRRPPARSLVQPSSRLHARLRGVRARRACVRAFEEERA